MPELNRLIDSWKRSVANLTDTQCAELEDHLRAEIASLQSAGLSENEAFTVARMRVGSPSELQLEYSRVNPGAAWAQRLRWIVAGYLLCVAANSLLGAGCMWMSALLARHGAGLATLIAVQMSAVGIVTAAAVSGWYLWRQYAPTAPATIPGPSTRLLWIVLVVAPWALSSMKFIQEYSLNRLLPVATFGAVVQSSHIVGIVAPFAMPIILLIIGSSLERRNNATELT